MEDLSRLLNDKPFLESIMERLMLARKFEDEVFSLFKRGRLHGTTHLCVGEEATGVGSIFALKPQDCVLSTHRGHGQALAKGIPVDVMMAEMLGKESGSNRGRGGSMHISDPSINAFGVGGVIGASCPIACGIALSFKLRGENDRVAVVFFGDGSSNEGAVHEAMNLAAAWSLPVLFICTDNGYGMSTPLAKAVNDVDLTKRGYPFGIMSTEVDGNDVLAVYRTVRAARARVTGEGKPAFIVEHTYRTSGHSKSDRNLYRTEAEISDWQSNNPVARFTRVMLENGFSESDIDAIDARTSREIAEALAYAESCPEPAATPRELEAEAYCDPADNGECQCVR
ncbi:MAG: thiamine pyrophosphate-dependent dehydrogenase E1 component subunit alpha [Clostridiales Family XIII bacterium]|jgi:pyruvate dehydrogenase E1 component alpha subunit|nr:thiamine pyrophosphate-dependent dehydrogenase E1 component subunit alpha [Clostridiales Family XIII bacterium]